MPFSYLASVQLFVDLHDKLNLIIFNLFVFRFASSLAK